MADQTLAKYINERRILTLLRTQGEASRAEIARRLKLTPATITRLINGLTGRNLVRDVRRDVTSSRREPGRPGVAVTLNPGGAYFLGVEIGVGHMRFAVIDLAADVASVLECNTPANITPRQAVAKISAQFGKLQQDPRFRGRIEGVGITVPGLVNTDGFIVHLPILGWKNVDLVKLLHGKVNVSSFVENNANAAAFGAAYTHPAIAGNSAIFLKLGTGCGGAAIVGGRLLRGARGMASEFGHIRVADHGVKCYCGQTGCLETFVNLKALARHYLGTEELSVEALEALPEDVALKAGAGDAKADDALLQLGTMLSRGIASLVNAFNPAIVFLGGPMRAAIAVSLGSIRKNVAGAIVPGMTVPVIKMSEHGNLECAVGAATIAHHHLFDAPWTDMADSYDEMSS